MKLCRERGDRREGVEWRKGSVKREKREEEMVVDVCTDRHNIQEVN